MREFTFNTGVKVENNRLGPTGGRIAPNGVWVIPFTCEVETIKEERDRAQAIVDALPLDCIDTVKNGSLFDILELERKIAA